MYNNKIIVLNMKIQNKHYLEAWEKLHPSQKKITTFSSC